MVPRAKTADATESPRDIASLIAQELIRVREAITLRAEELCEQRGRADGHALDDWLAAEAQVLGTRRYQHNARSAAAHRSG